MEALTSLFTIDDIQRMYRSSMKSFYEDQKDRFNILKGVPKENKKTIMYFGFNNVEGVLAYHFLKNIDKNTCLLQDECCTEDNDLVIMSEVTFSNWYNCSTCSKATLTTCSDCDVKIKVDFYPVRLNKFGNYTDKNNFVFDKQTHKVTGFQEPDGKVVPLTIEQKLELSKKGFKF